MTCSNRLFCEEDFFIVGIFGLHLITQGKHVWLTPRGLWSCLFYLCPYVCVWLHGHGGFLYGGHKGVLCCLCVLYLLSY